MKERGLVTSEVEPEALQFSLGVEAEGLRPLVVQVRVEVHLDGHSLEGNVFRILDDLATVKVRPPVGGLAGLQQQPVRTLHQVDHFEGEVKEGDEQVVGALGGEDTLTVAGLWVVVGIVRTPQVPVHAVVRALLTYVDQGWRCKTQNDSFKPLNTIRMRGLLEG